MLATRMATSFVYGIQIGWFSLGGVTSGPHLDRSCGPMGTYDQWMDPHYAPEVAFLQLLEHSRGTVSAYVTDGRLVLPPTLTPTPPIFKANTPGILNPGPFPVVSHAAWRLDRTQTVVFLFAAATHTAFTTSVTADMRDYDFPEAGTTTFSISQINPDGSRTRVGTAARGLVTLPVTVGGRAVLMYEIAALS